jgi:hypothetical protein
LKERGEELVLQAELGCWIGGEESTETGHKDKEKNNHSRDNWKAPNPELQDMAIGLRPPPEKR